MSYKPRPDIIHGTTTKVACGCGNLYVTINSDADGPFEIFVVLGKAGGCGQAQVKAIGQLASLSLRYGVPHADIVKKLIGIQCPSPRISGGITTLSCADAVAQVLKSLGGPEDDSLE